MEFLSELWMPIVLSAVFVWIASSIMHMVLPHHKGEIKGLPNEDGVVASLEGAPAGQYMVPFGTMEEMKSDAFKARQQRLSGIMTIWPAPSSMGRNLMLMLLFCFVVGVFVAYVAWNGLGAGPNEYLHVFRVVGATAFAAHGLGWIPGMIWFGGKGFWTYTFDAIVYALLTAGTFGWLWPDA